MKADNYIEAHKQFERIAKLNNVNIVVLKVAARAQAKPKWGKQYVNYKD